MSNIDFTSEFSRRAENLFNDRNKSQELLTEFESLDPREASIVYRGLSFSTTSVEHLHVKTRLRALVAAGSVSQDLADVISNELTPTKSDYSDSELSRLNLSSALDLYLTDNGKNLMDPDGEFQYRIDHGYSKDQLNKYIRSRLFFKSQEELMQEGSAGNEDVATQLANYKFNVFLDALESIVDEAEPVNFKEKAKELLKKYDESGEISNLIDSGASANTVLEALDGVESWQSDATDFLTKDDVDYPRNEQRQAWSDFLNIVNAIKDLDSAQ